jgi:hypothetical protein
MSLAMRIFFFGIIGIFAGMAAWPFAELILFYQPSFTNLLIFNITLGIAVGICIGGSFGMSEGIISSIKAKVKTGILTGILIGAIGGILGFIAGQAALLFIGTHAFNSTGRYNQYGIPLSRAVGWALFGLFIGMGEGLRSRSGAKVRNGIIGGFIGGFLGGLVVEYARFYSPQSHFARLGGLVVLGGFIGMFYGLIENRLAEGSLRLLSGSMGGREFLLSQKTTRIGESEKTEVTLSGYRNVADYHVEIKRAKNSFTIVDAGTKRGTYVNDQKIEETRLQNGDVIRVGDAQFQFYKKK